MSRILKFTLPPGPSDLPGIRRVLTVGWQGNDLRLWAEADEHATDQTRFYSALTGEAPPDDAEYVGTAVGAPWVVHVYRRPR